MSAGIRPSQPKSGAQRAIRLLSSSSYNCLFPGPWVLQVRTPAPDSLRGRSVANTSRIQPPNAGAPYHRFCQSASANQMTPLFSRRRLRFFRALAFLAVCCLGLPQTLPAQQNSLLHELVFEEVARDLLRPVGITHAGDGSGRLFINLQDGPIRIHDGDRLLEKPFLDITLPGRMLRGARAARRCRFIRTMRATVISSLITRTTLEGFGKTVISRWRVSRDDPNVADPDSEKVLLTL